MSSQEQRQAQRWDELRDMIVNFYIEGKMSLADIAKRMAVEHNFYQNERAYKHRLQNWGVKRRTTTAEKNALISVLGKNYRSTTSDVSMIQGGVEKRVDKRQMKRFLDAQLKQKDELCLASGIFLHWGLPYLAHGPNIPSHAHQPLSPKGKAPEGSTSFVLRPCDGQHSETESAASPTAELVHRKFRGDNASLLIQGRYDELLKRLADGDRKVLINWLNDFWMFSFVTAKRWGRMPEPDGLSTRATVPIDSPAQNLINDMSTPDTAASQRHINGINPPSQLCRWSIHIRDVDFEHKSAPAPEPDPGSSTDEPFGILEDLAPQNDLQLGIGDSRLGTSEHASLSSVMREALVCNSFSSLGQSDLPLLTPPIIDAVTEFSDQLEADAWGFVIKSRNLDLLDDYLQQAIGPMSLIGVYPFHLAASYLDGAGSCCLVLNRLLNNLDGYYSLAANFRNELDHTVLDSLMLNILRSHTSISAKTASDAFTSNRFPAEEVDICGRWDADSPCIRQLYASGRCRIPPSWKHPFCHTAAQAICHAITNLFVIPWGPDINSASGLFSKRCNSCGTDLRILPLHCLVLVAYHLANNGTPGETLFGAIACLCCLLSHGANPDLKAEISISLLLGEEEECGSDQCSHTSLRPRELASKLPYTTLQHQPRERRLGWETFTSILEFAGKERRRKLSKTVNVDRAWDEFDTESCAGHDEPGDRGSEVEDLWDSWEDSVRSWTAKTQEHDDKDSDAEEEINDFCNNHAGYWYGGTDYICVPNWYCGSRKLGILWASVQTEMLTYRRLSEQDPWVSSNFDIEGLFEGMLAGQGPTRIPLYFMDLMKTFSLCGWFPPSFYCPTAPDACRLPFMNLDHGSRATYIPDANMSYF